MSDADHKYNKEQCLTFCSAEPHSHLAGLFSLLLSPLGDLCQAHSSRHENLDASDSSDSSDSSDLEEPAWDQTTSSCDQEMEKEKENVDPNKQNATGEESREKESKGRSKKRFRVVIQSNKVIFLHSLCCLPTFVKFSNCQNRTCNCIYMYLR